MKKLAVLVISSALVPLLFSPFVLQVGVARAAPRIPALHELNSETHSPAVPESTSGRAWWAGVSESLALDVVPSPPAIDNHGPRVADIQLGLGRRERAPIAAPIPIPPPPRNKPRVGDINGRVDLPLDFEPGWVRVRIAPGMDVNRLVAKHSLPGPVRYWNRPAFTALEKQLGLDRDYRIGVRAGTEKQTALLLAAAKADFEYVYLAWIYPVKVSAAPNDTLYAAGYQGSLPSIGMPKAWDRTISSDLNSIGVIDSGFRGTHEDAGNWKQKTGWDFTVPDGQPIVPGSNTDDTNCFQGHGTRVIGIAAADTNNNRGIAGAGWNSGIKPIKALVWNGARCIFTSRASRADPVRWATNNSAVVINMSYVIGPFFDQAEQDALTAAWTSGLIPVAGAGNDNTSDPQYPCANLYTVCVGASDNAGNKASFSNYGASWVDFFAPGITIWTTTATTNTSYDFGSGTSYATPHVSGVAALQKSIGKTPQQAFDDLVATATPNQWTAFGFINAGNALWR